MRKSAEQIKAELLVRDMLMHDTAEKCLQKARELKNKREFAIAQRVTLTIMLCTIWDFYEDFNEDMLKDLYKQYLAYHESFDKGNENIYKQMVEIDKMLGGDILKERFFDVITTEAEDE